MHLPSNSVVFIVFVKLVVLAVGTRIGINDGAVYFPPDDNGSPIVGSQDSRLQDISLQDLQNLRGTTAYEKYVDGIISRGIGTLTIEMNKLLEAQTKGSENVLFSPLSITNALALVLLGSNGKTFKEISEFWGLHIGIPDIDRKSQIVHEQFGRMLKKLNQTSGLQVGQEVKAASAIFVQEGYPIRPIYRSTAEELYESSILNVDFETRSHEAQTLINNWVSQKTNNKIKNILAQTPSRDTRVIITSVLYFKAEWKQHFFAGNTNRRPFYVNGRNSNTNIEVELMANGGEFPYYKDVTLGCEVLGLPYKGNKSTMYAILPFESSREKLYDFQSRITVADLTNLAGKTKKTGAVFLFPKMKIESTIDLKDTLKAMGVTSLFDARQANLALLSPGRVNNVESRVAGKNTKSNANEPIESIVPSVGSRIGFSESIDNIRQSINEQSSDNNFQNPGLYADQVLHKVYMDITEKGTEAAAATSVSLSRTGDRVTLRFDVPFCFFIRHDETNTILFWGSVVTPTPHFPV